MIKKTKIALGIATASITVAGALVSPQVLAQSGTDLQDQMSEMAVKMEAMQTELDNVRSSSSSSYDGSSERASVAHVASKDHQFIVRGGWARSFDNRGSTEGLFGVGEDLLTDKTDKDAFYYGGAIDFNMNNDFFGLADGVSFGIEFGVEYAELGDRHDNGFDNLLTAATGPDGVTGGEPTDLQQTVTVNRLRINASPKIKFMHGSAFRPWIIPAGLDINIISPPSDAITVLNTGMNFGAGFDFELIPNVVLGADARYHWTPDDIDGVDTDGLTVGGVVGFKF
jgi:hypothetical protein